MRNVPNARQVSEKRAPPLLSATCRGLSVAHLARGLAQVGAVLGADPAAVMVGQVGLAPPEPAALRVRVETQALAPG
eukprot:8777041-Alexandrium_andersonii.AAC.1